MNVKWGVPFPKTIKLKPGETVIFAWIVYKSRADRDRVNAKVMKDKRLTAGMDEARCPSTVSGWSTAASRSSWRRNS